MISQSKDAASILDRVVFLLSTMEEVRAVGLTGSRASGHADAFSDIDLMVIGAKRVPAGEDRLRLYRELQPSEVPIFDVDLGVLRNDLLSMDGTLLDVNWCAIPGVERFLRELEQDPDCDEFLPGGL